MTIRSKHLHFLRKRYLPRTSFPNTGHVLAESELAVLRKYGQWFNALDRGWLPPISDAQQHFVECCRGKANVQSSYERTWIKYRNTVRDEDACSQGRKWFDMDLDYEEEMIEEALRFGGDDLLERRVQEIRSERKDQEQFRKLHENGDE